MTTKLTHKERALSSYKLIRESEESAIGEVVSQLQQAFHQVANEALEEAAKMCELAMDRQQICDGVTFTYTALSPVELAAAIRDLKESGK